MTKVTITTAVPLSTKQRETVEAALAKKYGAELAFEEVVNTALIGGIKVRVGSKEFDGSVKAKLTQLHQSLVEQL